MSPPFFQHTSTTAAGDVVIVQISRDKLVPVRLQNFSGAVDGYAEGNVVNTVFGSFPHSTLIGVPWGAQVRASAVDTGSRGRKRKRGGDDVEQRNDSQALQQRDSQRDGNQGGTAPETVTASSGFVHVLRPTPELWTMSLPHRTQVVYTPDYSFILQRLRAFPGTQLIEAGAGSGSFTHASARAVYGGPPTSHNGREDEDDSGKDRERGKVWSYELDKARYIKIQEEIDEHGLQEVVQVTHRNVCEGGFLVNGASPNATAVFLDLPAPWEALRHLARRRPGKRQVSNDDDNQDIPTAQASTDSTKEDWISPLDPTKTAYVCAFSPCIEQVTRTIATMRELGWVDIDMVEIAHKKLVVQRERIGTSTGADAVVRDVDEALARLRVVNKKRHRFHGNQTTIEEADNMAGAEAGEHDSDSIMADDVVEATSTLYPDTTTPNKNTVDTDADDVTDRPWRHGRLQARPEPELKTHTSYLTFAVLPREWTDADEDAALAKWGVQGGKLVGQAADRMTRKKIKAEMHQPRKDKK